MNLRPNNGMCFAIIPRYLIQNFIHTIENQNHVTYIYKDFCPLLLTFANRLDPDQDRHSVEHDLDPKLFDSLMVLLKVFFKKVNKE